MGSPGGSYQPPCLIVCFDGRLNALFLNCVFVLIFAHFQYVLVDIWISQRAARQDASTLFFFFLSRRSLWAWIYKLKNQAKMTLIRSPSFCGKCWCSAGTRFTATICCLFSLTKSISSFTHACSDNAEAPAAPLNPAWKRMKTPSCHRGRVFRLAP